MMEDFRQQALEQTLSRMCSDLDNYLEDKYGRTYPVHPNRPIRGKAANPAHDGLFSTGTMFTLGFGSKYGRGYILDMEIRTLTPVDPATRRMIEEDGVSFLSGRLKDYFPDRDLRIERDGRVWKIVGDFSLGTAS